jgi:tetratricopeptide (TPR) repeat protein
LAHTYWNLFEIKSCLEVQRDILMTQMWSRQSVRDWMCWPPWKPVHIPYCATLDELTRSLWLAGMRDLSKRTGERAVAGLSQKLGTDDPQTLNAMFNLARTYLHLGEHTKSYDLLKHVLDRREHFFGIDHPDTLMARNELGMNLCAQRIRMNEAEGLVRSTFETRRRVLGEEHAYTLWSANDLSKVLCELRRFEEARALLEEVPPIVERTLGADHAGMHMTKSNLSRIYILVGEWEGAAKLIAELEAVIPCDHPDYIHLQWGRAFLFLNHDKNLEEAERVCDWIMERVFQAKALAKDNARVISTAGILLRIYEAQEREADILELKTKFPTLGDCKVLGSINHLPLDILRRRHTEERRQES